MKSASWVAIQLKKPFLWAERIPFRFAEMILGMVRKEKGQGGEIAGTKV
jgi:hypothetical protein